MCHNFRGAFCRRHPHSSSDSECKVPSICCGRHVPSLPQRASESASPQFVIPGCAAVKLSIASTASSLIYCPEVDEVMPGVPQHSALESELPRSTPSPLMLPDEDRKVSLAPSMAPSEMSEMLWHDVHSNMTSRLTSTTPSDVEDRVICHRETKWDVLAEASSARMRLSNVLEEPPRSRLSDISENGSDIVGADTHPLSSSSSPQEHLLSSTGAPDTKGVSGRVPKASKEIEEDNETAEQRRSKKPINFLPDEEREIPELLRRFKRMNSKDIV